MDNQTDNINKTLTLNGQVITLEQLQEKQKDQSIRIIEKETGSGNYVMLQKLKG